MFRLPRLLLAVVLLSSGCWAATNAFAAPAGQEPIAAAGSGGYPQLWPPGPPESSAPDWARPGLVRFARWDGGPIETCKAFLSGWPGMNPPVPDYLYVTTNWYDPSTVRFLRDARVNLVWVTFSNGFSITSEKPQRDLLRPYIAQCHKNGIHVLAYESVANLFWEDMFQNEPQSKDWVLLREGKPVPYGAGDYTKMGRVTRYMADLSKPAWRAYLKKRIDLAIDAGADGIMYDNCLAGSTVETAAILQEMMGYSLSRKSDFLMMANFHRDKYILNRVLNAITTEDGGEAGVFSEKNLESGPRRGERATMLPVEGGRLVNNVGLLRTFENLAEGWKPVAVESNLRETGERFRDFMRPERQKLATAEPMMFGVSNEAFVELRFAHDLWRGEPEAVAAWTAIGQYNAFFADNAQYYRGARSVATLGVVLDNRSEGQEVMNGLAARNVLFNVLYEHELTPERLRPYAAVFLLSAETIRARAMESLEQYVAAGGKLLAVAPAATKDEHGNARARPDWFGEKHGRGETIYWEAPPAIDDLAAAVRKADRPPAVRLEAPPGVLYNVTRQGDSGRLTVHLLNYLPKPVKNVVVTVEGKHQEVTLLTPDARGEEPRIARDNDAATRIEVPRLGVYSLLVLSGKR